MEDGARVDDEPAVITLGDGPQLVSEQDRGRLLHCGNDIVTNIISALFYMTSFDRGRAVVFPGPPFTFYYERNRSPD